MKEKYGFIYVWFDRKYKRYYIGSHWGHEDDGYICSSPMMKSSYKRRTTDFKRRIVKKIFSSRAELLEEEQRWLNMIDNEKMPGKNKNFRYYNMSKSTGKQWFADEAKRKEIIEKRKGPRPPEVGVVISAAKKGKPLTEAHKEALRGIKKASHTEEWKVANSERMKRQWADGTRSRVCGTMSDEHKEKIGMGNRGKKLSDTQIESLRNSSSKTYTITFFDGRTEIVHGLKRYATNNELKYVTLFKAAQRGTSIKKYDIESIVS